MFVSVKLTSQLERPPRRDVGTSSEERQQRANEEGGELLPSRSIRPTLALLILTACCEGAHTETGAQPDLLGLPLL